MAEAHTPAPGPRAPERSEAEHKALLEELRQQPKTVSARVAYLQKHVKQDPNRRVCYGQFFSFAYIGKWCADYGGPQAGFTKQGLQALCSGERKSTSIARLYALAAFFRVKPRDIDPNLPDEQDTPTATGTGLASLDEGELDRRIAAGKKRLLTTGVNARGQGMSNDRVKQKAELLALIEAFLSEDQADGKAETQRPSLPLFSDRTS